jgi:hypothetical protein
MLAFYIAIAKIIEPPIPLLTGQTDQNSIMIFAGNNITNPVENSIFVEG